MPVGVVECVFEARRVALLVLVQDGVHHRIAVRGRVELGITDDVVKGRDGNRCGEVVLVVLEIDGRQGRGHALGVHLEQV